MIDLEAAVLRFLERREQTPGLTPEAYADEFPEERGEVLRAVRAAVSIESMLPSQGDRGLESIAGYSILDEIGRGGMGIVYRAEKDGESYALKILPNAPLLGPRALERFRREAAALSRLDDPGIVNVHDANVDCDVPYIVMDLVHGVPLQAMAKPFPVSEAAGLVEKIARTIHTIHEQGIVHRDLKPQNVLVLPDGQPVIVDFGLSAAIDLASLTATGDLLGTPRYMAPEQMLGKETDRRTDVFALGLILYELVTGKPARGKTAVALAAAPAHFRIRSPRSVRPDLPRPLDHVLRTALATDPERRYPTALAFAQDLQRLMSGESVAARPPGPLAQAKEWIQSTLGRARTDREPDEGSDSVHAGETEHAEISRQTEEALNRAATAWLDGDSGAASRELAALHRLSSRNATARVLEAHLLGRAPSEDWTAPMQQFHHGLQLLREGSFADPPASSDSPGHSSPACREALEQLETLSRWDFHAPLVAAATGFAAHGAGDLRLAETELVAATRRLVDCTRLHLELALVQSELGRLPEAEQTLLHAATLSPDNVAVWRTLASVYDRLGNIESGLRAVERIGQLEDASDPATRRILASLKDQAGERDTARSILSALINDDPADHASRYLLGLSWDRDHRIGEASACYHEVLSIRPAHTASLINLAYLHSGALRGKCKKCDLAYEERPDCLDLEKAEGFLVRALEADRGSNASLIRTAVDVAFRLEDRSRLIARLEELTSSSSKTPESLQLEQVLRTLRITE